MGPVDLGPPPPMPALSSSRAPLTATKSCPAPTPSKPQVDLMYEIRNHKGLKKTEPTKSKSLDFPDELKARIAKQRKAVDGEEAPSKGIARSLSDMISEPESEADTPDPFDDSFEGEFC